MAHSTGSEIRIFANARVLTGHMGGVQRYARELFAHLGANLEPLQPIRPCQGWSGHLWEQYRLPRRACGLLWSPANTGPVRHPTQVVTIHDAAPLDNPEWYSRAFARWYGWLVPRLLRGARHIVTDSDFSRRRLCLHGRIDEERITVIYPGITADFLPRAEQERSRVQHRLPSKKYILSLSTLEPRKNLTTLLAAWQEVHPMLPADLWLVLAGGTGSAAVFRQAGLGPLPPRVFLTGPVSNADLPVLYSGAEAFVFPSLYEGFGFPPLEAMACRVPVLASRAGSLPEVLGDAAAYVFDSRPATWGRALIDLHHDEGRRQALAAQGPPQAARYTWSKCAREILTVLEREAAAVRCGGLSGSVGPSPRSGASLRARIRVQ